MAAFLEEAHGRMLEMQGTARGTSWWWECMAAGAGADHRLKILQFLFLLDNCIDVGLLPCAALIDDEDEMDAEVRDTVAHCLWVFARSLIGFETLLHLLFQQPPHCFLALLSRDDTVKQHGLRLCNFYAAALQAVDEAEGEARVIGEELLHSLLWPDGTWNREVLLALEECEGRDLPTDIAAEVDAMQRRSGSVIVEDTLNYLRSQQRQQQSGQLGPSRTWHRLVDCGLLEDNDVVDLSKSSDLRDGIGNQVTKDTFKPNPADLSLGDGGYNTLFDTVAWRNPGPNLLKDLPVGSQALIACRHDLNRLRTVWQSRLAIPGFIIFDEAAPDEYLYVIRSTAFGAIVAEAAIESVDDCAVVRLRLDRSAIRTIHIDRHRSFKALPTRVKAPRRMPRVPRPRFTGLEGVLIEVVGDITCFMPIVEAAATAAFVSWTKDELLQLAAFMQFRGRHGSSEHAIVTFVVAQVLPSLSPDEVAAIVAQRKTKKSAVLESALTPENLATIEENFVHQDIEAAARNVHKHLERQERAQGLPPPDPVPTPSQLGCEGFPAMGSGGDCALPPSSRPELVPPATPPAAEDLQPVLGAQQPTVGPPRTRNPCTSRLPDEIEYGALDAKAWLPPVKGCTCWIHSDGRAWVARFAHRVTSGPKTHHVTFGGNAGFSMNYALRRCLEWAWERALEADASMVCPHDWSCLGGPPEAEDD